MKIFLASLLEPQNFGSGRKIAIFHKKDDKDLGIDFYFKELTPSIDLIEKYNRKRPIVPEEAKTEFINGFRRQLSELYDSILKESEELGIKDLEHLLPFQDGDTLLSWEREENNNYRSLVAELLYELNKQYPDGYNISLH